MELFKFNYASEPTVLERGEFINGAKSIMWTERYREPGEFKIEAQLSSGLLEFLPRGTLISHVDTLEIMIVENHEISEKTKEDPKLTISGRSFDSYLENRPVGLNLVRASSTISEYILTADYTWNQAQKLIIDHVVSTGANDMLTEITVSVAPIYITGVSEARTINRGDIHKALMEILAIDDLGIKTIRKHTFTGYPGFNFITLYYIYMGEDKSSTVIFSWKGGDLDSAEYLFSNKRDKNSAMVVGRYVWRMVDTGPINYARRIMIVEADDIDGHLTAVPTGGTLTTILSKMDVRGRQALQSNNEITISRTDISNITKYRYRTDYNVGDLIALDGNFGQTAIMRVTEYVEIEDENGESGHPTLALPGA